MKSDTQRTGFKGELDFHNEDNYNLISKRAKRGFHKYGKSNVEQMEELSY